MLLCWAYVRFGALPQAAWLLGGVEPVVLAIIDQALASLGLLLRLRLDTAWLVLGAPWLGGCGTGFDKTIGG